MQFYRFEGITKADKSEESKSPRDAMIAARQIAMSGSEYNYELDDKEFFTITEINETVVSGVAIAVSPDSFNKRLPEFLKKAGVSLFDITVKEITLRKFSSFLHSAERKGFQCDDEVMEKFKLEGLTGRYNRDIEFGENLLDEISQEELIESSEKFLSKKTLIPEISRIFKNSERVNTKGHPVHYIMMSYSDNTRKDTYRILLNALYNAGRIKNRRYCYIDIEADSRFSDQSFDDLYSTSEGGAVVIRYLPTESLDDEFITGERSAIAEICSVVKKYRNKVLTVFSFPVECSDVKKDFFENLVSLSFVEIKDEPAYDDDARKHLLMMAKTEGVEADEKLSALPVPGKGYIESELDAMFEEWYDGKLKSSLYPEYKDCVCVRKELAEEKPKGSAYDELMSMTGLGAAKKVINQALDYYKAQKLFKDMGMKEDHPSMHMCFTGNSGTCKTTVARLFARILQDNGILSKGHLVECSRKDLVAKYVGHTAKCVEEKLKAADGGVLFIDEAYSLALGNSGSFGQEAIDALVKGIEDRRDSMVVIFAGYSKEMENFIQANSGIRSRIAFHVQFDDYSTDELCSIADYIAEKKGLKLTAESRLKLRGTFETARKVKDFGNGRYVRNVIEQSRLAQASRIMRVDFDSLTRDDIATITEADIVVPDIGNHRLENQIGFMAS